MSMFLFFAWSFKLMFATLTKLHYIVIKLVHIDRDWAWQIYLDTLVHPKDTLRILFLINDRGINITFFCVMFCHCSLEVMVILEPEGATLLCSIRITMHCTLFKCNSHCVEYKKALVQRAEANVFLKHLYLHLLVEKCEKRSIATTYFSLKVIH